jgi:hypothetical protein
VVVVSWAAGSSADPRISYAWNFSFLYAAIPTVWIRVSCGGIHGSWAVITIKRGVNGLTDMHLRGLGGDEADETLPLLLCSVQIDIIMARGGIPSGLAAWWRCDGSARLPLLAYK